MVRSLYSERYLISKLKTLQRDAAIRDAIEHAIKNGPTDSTRSGSKGSGFRIITGPFVYFDMPLTKVSRPFQAICTPMHSNTKAIMRKTP